MKNNNATKIISTLWKCFNEQKWDEASLLLAEDFTATWPQSREKMTGLNFIEVNRRYPGTHKIEVLTLHHQYNEQKPTNTVISEVFIQSQMPDGKQIKLFAVSIFAVKDNKIKSATEYWSDCYPAPEWRKDLVEVY